MKFPEYDPETIPHFIVATKGRIAKSATGSRKTIEPTRFYFCKECRHQIGVLKTSCRCDGSCHPVIEAWDEEKAQRAEAKARGRGRPKTKPRGKAPKQYNDLGRI